MTCTRVSTLNSVGNKPSAERSSIRIAVCNPFDGSIAWITLRRIVSAHFTLSQGAPRNADGLLCRSALSSTALRPIATYPSSPSNGYALRACCNAAATPFVSNPTRGTGSVDATHAFCAVVVRTDRRTARILQINQGYTTYTRPKPHLPPSTEQAVKSLVHHCAPLAPPHTPRGCHGPRP